MDELKHVRPLDGPIDEGTGGAGDRRIRDALDDETGEANMDNSRNENVHDDDLAGLGDDGAPRGTEKMANARNNKDVRRGRDMMAGRAGEDRGGGEDS